MSTLSPSERPYYNVITTQQQTENKYNYRKCKGGNFFDTQCIFQYTLKRAGLTLSAALTNIITASDCQTPSGQITGDMR